MDINALYQSVTQSIIKDLEAGVAPWTKPWKGGARGGLLPFNAVSNRSYSGINIPILWAEQQRHDYPTQAWLTYKQAQAAGAQVRAGEKASTVVFTKKLSFKDDEDVQKQVSMLRTFSVFNEAQVDGLPKVEEPIAPEPSVAHAAVESFVQATGVDIRHGGDKACYIPFMDYVLLPHETQFEGREHYLATKLHELVHWSGHKRRLDRDLTGRFRTKSYAAEELIAELGAAFLCAHLSVEGKLRHADYIAVWLELLKNDDRAIFTAASKASQAADYLRAFSEKVDAEAA